MLAQANAEMTPLQKDLFARFIPSRFQHDEFFEKAYLASSDNRHVAILGSQAENNVWMMENF